MSNASNSRTSLRDIKDGKAMRSRFAGANSVEKSASDITQDITAKNTAGVYSRKNRRGRVRHSLFTCAAALAAATGKKVSCPSGGIFTIGS